MRSLGLALLALALSAPTASAAVIEIRENYCGCDPSSGDEDTRTLIVRALPGEENVLRVETRPRGVLVTDLRAELTGACRPATGTAGRFCRGAFSDAELLLGDGDDSVEVDGLSSFLDAGPGADSVLVRRNFIRVVGGPGPDRIEAALEASATVSYVDRSEGVTVRMNGVADDGAPGEGDDLRGAITGIEGGSGDDLLDGGPRATSLLGGDGDDRLTPGPIGGTTTGGPGDDELLGADGNDFLVGGPGADVLSGGEGFDQASWYEHSDPLTLSIGDGANDGAAGEGDDIRADVEEVAGGDGADLIVGDDNANGLSGGLGRDTLRGRGGGDFLEGWGDGDLLDAGSGADSVRARGKDLLELVDGERDRVRCGGQGPAIHADDLDVLAFCAPRLWMRTGGFGRRGVIRVVIRCETQSTVPCIGSVSLRFHGKRVSRLRRFGPMGPGRRKTVKLTARVLPRPGACLGVRAVTIRDDADTRTVSTTGACRPPAAPGRRTRLPG